MNELDWVNILRKTVPKNKGVIVGIGDDCAAVRLSKRTYLLKSDLFIEGIHFVRSRMTPQAIGMRAVGRVLSDFAACAGKPLYLGVSVGVPKEVATRDLRAMLAGITAMSTQYGFSLIGGDTSRAKTLFFDVWGVGEARRFIGRHTARNGDYIFLSGRLGQRPFHKPFKPRIEEARYLERYCKTNAMIDVSDGLLIDLYRILQESKKGAILFGEQIPVTKGKSDWCRGEDYELLFTVDKNERNISRLKKKFYYIGKITTPKSGYTMQYGSRSKPVVVKGYTHL